MARKSGDTDENSWRRNLRKILSRLWLSCVFLLRSVFGRKDFLCGFLFLCRRISSRILSLDSFSSFSWEKVHRKILQENPRRNPPKFIQQKSPTTFCRGAVPLLFLRSWGSRRCSFHCFLFNSETGRIRFRGVRFQTQSSVSFLGLTEFGERTQWVPFSLLFVGKSELTEFFAELTEFAVKLSEFSSPKQYSRNSIPPVSYQLRIDTLRDN